MKAIPWFLFLFPSVASAARGELICRLAGDGLVQIDGVLDEWSGPSLTKGDPRDSALAIRCAYDERTLYLLVEVSDERVVRGRAEDALILAFGDARLRIAPASDRATRSARWETGRGKLPEIADTMLPRGFAVELALPLAATPGWAKGVPSLRFAATHVDADMATGGEPPSRTDTGEVLLTFEEAARALKAFLAEIRLAPRDVTVDTLAEMNGEPGPERVIVAGTVLGVLGGDGYAYIALPVASPRDLLGVELVDLAGEGQASAVVRYREHGGGGSRDVLAVFNLRHDGFTRLFAHEIGKQLGPARLTNRWELRKAKKGRELVITPGEAAGVSAETWNETPASDMVPILLPWGEKQQEVWRFEKDAVSGG
jgi:hypothetical protein